MEESFEGNVWFDWRSRRVNGVGILQTRGFKVEKGSIRMTKMGVGGE